MSDTSAPGLRYCTKCKQGLPADLQHFHAEKRRKSGLAAICKVCKNAYFRAQEITDARRLRCNRYKAANREYYTAYRRAHSAAHPGQFAAYQAQWRQDNPLKTAAHRLVHKAVKDGALPVYPCFVCGKTAEAHHPDYSAPLDVVWLCKTHHRQAHNLAVNIEKECRG